MKKLFLVALTACLSGQLFAAEQPNVILVFIDDLGWKDIGCYGNDFVETPHIDQLAADGVRFTDFYTTGYVGKWHLGNGPQFQPDRQGYDCSAVIGGPHLPGKYRVQGRSDLRPKANQYRTEFEADLSINFIRDNKDKPFFLMLSPYAVHIPLGAMSDKVEKYRKKAAERDVELPHPVYAAMIEHCDEMVGRIVDVVAREGLTGKTMIVFTLDNGGLYRRYDYREQADDSVASQAPLKGEKGSLHEGGVRVPLIVNLRPHRPERCALPDCATPRYTI